MANAKRPKKPGNRMANFLRLSVFWAIIIVVGITLMALFNPNENLREVPISDVIARANKGEIAKIEASAQPSGRIFRVA